MNSSLLFFVCGLSARVIIYNTCCVDKLQVPSNTIPSHPSILGHIKANSPDASLIITSASFLLGVSLISKKALARRKHLWFWSYDPRLVPPLLHSIRILLAVPCGHIRDYHFFIVRMTHYGYRSWWFSSTAL